MTAFEKIIIAYGKVQRVSVAVWGGKPSPSAISVVDLHAAIQNLYGVAIEMRSVKFDADHVKSLVERWPEKVAIVAVQHDLPEPMRRYAAVKELCHVIVDQPEDFSTDGCATIDGLLYIRDLNLAAPENSAIRSEKLAEAMADELMYPHCFRKADYLALKDAESTTTLAGLALNYNVPDLVPSRVLRPLTMQLRDRIWGEVDKLKAA